MGHASLVIVLKYKHDGGLHSIENVDKIRKGPRIYLFILLLKNVYPYKPFNLTLFLLYLYVLSLFI